MLIASCSNLFKRHTYFGTLRCGSPSLVNVQNGVPSSFLVHPASRVSAAGGFRSILPSPSRRQQNEKHYTVGWRGYTVHLALFFSVQYSVMELLPREQYIVSPGTRGSSGIRVKCLSKELLNESTEQHDIFRR